MESLTEKGDLPKPIVTDMSLDNYTNPKDITFLTVGTGGDELGNPKFNPDYLVIQEDDEYGFVNLILNNDGDSSWRI